ncbi:ClpXP protease specificity-enhancing factor [Comamonas composti]|uniref:ClpXP protease specificity-enhancing factor n=1 Tax=Comamonas composti TaxID=408558 RepID=UPI00041BC41B|nr:ClpXP protease specificity-enhancing factor [Comamonas composti]
MTAPEATSTRPYLIRALFEWCTDNGFTPHLAVRVDRHVQVPREFVRDGEIVLNVSQDATSGLHMGNDFISFKARFGGQPREIMVPVDRVMAIYARETGQGMAFPPPDEAVDELSQEPQDVLESSGESEEQAAAAPSVVQLVSTNHESPEDDGPRTPTPAGGRPALKRVK